MEALPVDVVTYRAEDTNPRVVAAVHVPHNPPGTLRLAGERGVNCAFLGSHTSGLTKDRKTPNVRGPCNAVRSASQDPDLYKNNSIIRDWDRGYCCLVSVGSLNGVDDIYDIKFSLIRARHEPGEASRCGGYLIGTAALVRNRMGRRHSTFDDLEPAAPIPYISGLDDKVTIVNASPSRIEVVSGALVLDEALLLVHTLGLRDRAERRNVLNRSGVVGVCSSGCPRGAAVGRLPHGSRYLSSAGPR